MEDKLKTRAIAFWDGFAEQYDAYYQGGHIRRENKTIRWVMEQYIRDGWICDIGCGTGGFLDVMDVDPEWYTGEDAAPKMIEQAKKKHPQYRFQVADVDRSDCGEFGDQQIVCLFAWNYLIRPEMVIERIATSIRPGGVFIAVVYNRERNRQRDYPGGDLPQRLYSDRWFGRWFDRVESYPFRITRRYLWPAFEDGVIARLFPRLAVYRIVVCSFTPARGEAW